MKDYFLIVDTETTVTDKVADFAAIVVDRKGNIVTQCAVLVSGIFTDQENHSLFYDNNSPELWGKATLPKRYAQYMEMIQNGSRMIASVPAINRWLERARETYNPTLTAYNLAFDMGKCANTQIDLSIFDNSFCLWSAAFTKWGNSKRFLQFVLNVHGFNAPTKLGNMSFKTNAEIMARFVLNQPELPDEPHTALEDIIYYELPIFCALAKKMSKKDLQNSRAYNWRACQVKDFYRVK